MHRAEYYTESFSIEDGLLTRFVTAHWKDFENIVYKENENGGCWIKNFDCIYMQGWLISIPGEIERDNWGGRWEVEDEKWSEVIPNRMTHPGDYRRGKQAALVKELSRIAVELHPDFSYVLKKYKVYETHVLMQILTVWKKHPEIELLLAKGFYNIAMSPGFLKLTDRTRKKYLQFIKEHPKEKSITWGNLRQIVSYDISLQEWKDYQAFLELCHLERIGVSYPMYCYLSKLIACGKWTEGQRYYNKEMSLVVYYKDYLRMAKKAGHNIKDKYWKYPNDVVKAHNKVMRECDAIDEQQKLAAAIAREKRQREEAKTRVKAMALLRKKFKDFNLNIDGYQIFVSTDFDEWQKHAKALSQCIVAGGYYEGTADGRYTIVFIQKEGTPIATAEIRNDGTVGQFYADERDRDNCLPSEEVKCAFRKWLDCVPKSKFKKRQKKAA